MRKILFFLFLIIFFIILKVFHSGITGLVSFSELNVKISGVTKAEIKISYNSFVFVGEVVNLTVECTNTGSNTISEKIEVYIKDENLTEVGKYYDTTNILYPGEVRVFKTRFYPPDEGIWYIQARCYYDGYFVETWGAVKAVVEGICGNGVCEPKWGEYYETCPEDCPPPVCGNGYCEYNETYLNCPEDCPEPVCGNGICEYPFEDYYSCPQDCPWWVTTTTTTLPPPPPTIPPPPPGIPMIKLEYPKDVETYQNETTMVYIIVKNVGNATLSNLRVMIDVPYKNLEVDVSPKVLVRLFPNASSIFLLSIRVLPQTTPGNYTLRFKVVSDQIEEWGVITVIVKPPAPDEGPIIYQQILNYAFLISKVEQDIFKASLEGIDVSKALESLDCAKLHLSLAKDFWKKKDYTNAKKELEIVRKCLEDAMLKLSQAIMFKPVVFPIYLTIYIFLGVIAVIAFMFGISYWKKRKKRKPKLLEEAEKAMG